jgi:uncharacterized protein (TIGR03437 family)
MVSQASAGDNDCGRPFAMYHGSSSSMASNKFTLRLVFIIGLCAGLALPAAAQTFDTSGNGNLNGEYFVRQVLTTDLDTNTSAIGRAISIIGVMLFDGNGNYTFIGQMSDTMAGTSGVSYSTAGTYSVASNGLAQILNPIDSYVTGMTGTDIDYGAIAGVGPVSIVASATEGPYDDVFVAVQAGSGASNSTVNGSYNVGFIDFLQANASQVRDGYYTLTSAGTGSLGSVTVNGAMANQGSKNVAQKFSGVTYSIATPSGVGTLTFPTASTPLTALVSGQKTFYVSSDGTFLLGGDPNGFDLIIGIQSLSGSATNSMYHGTYFNAALENDASDELDGNNDIDSFYGSTLALGSQGATISHQRLTYFNQSAIDDTFAGPLDFASNGTFNDGAYQYELGINGEAVLIVGTGTTYSLSVNLRPEGSLVTTNVFIQPQSIFNAGSYAPITNSVAPGEFVTIYGSGFSSSTQSAHSLPLPTTLGPVQVTVNGVFAPLDYVSPTQINLVIPFETTASYATFQVMNNKVASNQVTVYTNLTVPGVFTIPSLNGTSYPLGIGPAAVTHLDYSVVTPENPAVAGETLVLYLTGLGAVTPSVVDGAAGSSNPTSSSNESGSIGVDVLDQTGTDIDSPSVSFAGLAPGLAGVYQINFVVPSGLASGPGAVDVSTNEAYTSEAILYIQ